MVKDLQPLQVLACELMLHVVNVCIFFSLHAAMFLGMDCLDFWYFVVMSYMLTLQNINSVTCHGFVEMEILLYLIAV